MNKKKQIVNWFHLGLQATFLYLTFSFIRALLHELGHGLAAELVGLEFKGFYGSVFGSSGAWINGSRSSFQSVVISSSGPMVDLLIGLIALFIILPHMKKWGARISWLIAAATTLISFWGLMMSTGFGPGDFANVASALNMPKFIFGILGIIGLVIFLFLLAKHMLSISSPYFAFRSFGQRFRIIFLFLGLPVMVSVIGYALMTGKYIILGQAVLVIGMIALLTVFIRSSSENDYPLPKSMIYVGAAAFIVSCIVWLTIFGPTIQNAKGIFWES